MTSTRSWPLDVLNRIACRAKCEPSAVAVRYDGPCTDARRRLTYGELDAISNLVAARLRDRLSPGDVVMLSGPNQAELVLAFVGTLKAGMTIFPMPPGMTAHGIRTAARRSGTTAVIGPPEMLDALAGPEMTAWELHTITNGAPAPGHADHAPAPALLLQSSGTTGRPKIVRRDGPSLDAVARNVHSAVGLRADDRVLALIAMCHSYGIENALLGPLSAGAQIVAMDGFDPTLVATVLTGAGVTVLPGVPFIFQMLADDVGAPIRHTLRLAYSAGAPLPASVFEGFARRTDIRIGQLYGATEIGSVTFNDPDDDTFDPSSVGAPMDGVSLRVLDADAPDVERPLPTGAQGHVAVRALSMLDRYVDDDTPALDREFFLTGDLGRLDAGGRLTITGRIKLQIDIGGAKVNPLEVEDVIKELPGVAECVVVPIAVTETLNRLRAIIVPELAAAPPTVEVMRRFAHDRLASYKVPRVFEVRASLPRSATGKILRRQIESDTP